MLRAFLNYEWKRAHKIPFNPVYAVELEPETRDAPTRITQDLYQHVRHQVHVDSAEGVGFEPTRTRQRPNGFQDHRHRPLGEPS